MGMGMENISPEQFGFLFLIERIKRNVLALV